MSVNNRSTRASVPSQHNYGRSKAKSMLNATLSRSKHAWGSMKKTVSGATVFRKSSATNSNSHEEASFLKFKKRNKQGKKSMRPSMIEKSPQPRHPNQSNGNSDSNGENDGGEKDEGSVLVFNGKDEDEEVLKVVYDGDKVVDEANIKVEERMRHIMRAKAKRRDEVFEATLEQDNEDNNSRTSRASLRSVKTFRTTGSGGGGGTGGGNVAARMSGINGSVNGLDSPVATLKRSFMTNGFNFGRTMRRKNKGRGTNSESSKRFVNLDIPKVPKPNEDKKLIKHALSKNMFFNDLSQEEIAMLIEAMSMRTVQENETIIAEGEAGDEFFVVRSGGFSITSGEEGNELSKCRAGGSFGELALILDSKRMVSVIATEHSQVYVLSRLTYRKVVAFSENDRLMTIRQALKTVPLLHSLTPEQISDVADSVQLVKFNKGDPIIVKGDVGDIFYFIKSGSVQCTKIKSDQEREVNDVVLGPNEYFGERALLVDEPRAANVIALESVICLALDRESFLKHLGSLRDIMQRNQSIRALKAMPLLHDMTEKQLSKLLDNFEEIRFLAGQQIIEQGSRNKYLYIIQEGEVEVQLFDKSDRQKHTTLGTLKAGDYFGESAFKSGSVANAEVTAVGAVVCQAIDVRRHLKSLKPIAQTLRRNHAARQKSALEAVKVTTQKMQEFEQTIQLEELKHIKTLGTGSFGRVKLVEHTKTGNTYALKILQKAFIVQCKQQNNVMNEKMVMMKAQHPFILTLHRTFVSKNCLYFLLEYIQGGELFSLLYNTNNGRLKSDNARFYAACVVDAISYLHKRHIVYRDLKPENVMIDKDGYIRVVDFGFAKKVSNKTFTLCGTPEYLPPETITATGHNRAVDYWAIGVLIYEMHAGFSPFSDPDSNAQEDVFQRVLRCRFMFPQSGFPSDARQLVRKLMKKDPRERLGMYKDGPDQIKEQPWFEDIDWDDLFQKRLVAPWVPRIDGNTDSHYFDRFAEDDTEINYKGSNRYWANF